MCMKLTVRLDVFFMTCEEVIFHFKVALISIGFATVRKIAIALKSENKSYFGFTFTGLWSSDDLAIIVRDAEHRATRSCVTVMRSIEWHLSCHRALDREKRGESERGREPCLLVFWVDASEKKKVSKFAALIQFEFFLDPVATVDMSIIVFFYSLWSIYSQLACKHLSVRFCPTSSDNSTQLTNGSVAVPAISGSSLFNVTTTTTTTTAMTFVVGVTKPGSDVRLGLDDDDDFPVVEVNRLLHPKSRSGRFSVKENKKRNPKFGILIQKNHFLSLRIDRPLRILISCSTAVLLKIKISKVWGRRKNVSSSIFNFLLEFDSCRNLLRSPCFKASPGRSVDTPPPATLNMTVKMRPCCPNLSLGLTTVRSTSVSLLNQIHYLELLN